MSIPVNATIKAVPNFLNCLRAARAFMVEQDVASATARFERLQAELIKARALLSFSPTSGRPARFLDARTGWGQFQVGQGWFKIILPWLQLRVTNRVPAAFRDKAEFTLTRLKLRDGERIIRQRRGWYRIYHEGKLTLGGLWQVAPLIAAAVEALA